MLWKVSKYKSKQDTSMKQITKIVILIKRGAQLPSRATKRKSKTPKSIYATKGLNQSSPSSSGCSPWPAASPPKPSATVSVWAPSISRT